jgi:hypothetical protein
LSSAVALAPTSWEMIAWVLREGTSVDRMFACRRDSYATNTSIGSSISCFATQAAGAKRSTRNASSGTRTAAGWKMCSIRPRRREVSWNARSATPRGTSGVCSAPGAGAGVDDEERGGMTALPEPDRACSRAIPLEYREGAESLLAGASAPSKGGPGNGPAGEATHT